MSGSPHVTSSRSRPTYGCHSNVSQPSTVLAPSASAPVVSAPPGGPNTPTCRLSTSTSSHTAANAPAPFVSRAGDHDRHSRHSATASAGSAKIVNSRCSTARHDTAPSAIGRRRAREAALQMLYLAEVGRAGAHEAIATYWPSPRSWR